MENNVEEQATLVFGETYLRRRPFLVITEVSRPADAVRTEKKGWKVEPGQLQTFEVPFIVDRVTDKHLSTAAFIVDILNRKMVKNRYSAQGAPEQFVAYYMEKYAEQIAEGLRKWAQRSALDISKTIPTEEAA